MSYMGAWFDPDSYYPSRRIVPKYRRLDRVCVECGQIARWVYWFDTECDCPSVRYRCHLHHCKLTNHLYDDEEDIMGTDFMELHQAMKILGKEFRCRIHPQKRGKLMKVVNLKNPPDSYREEDDRV